MNREYEIHCYHNNIDTVADTAFSAGKDTCGLIMSGKEKDWVHVVYGYGKHSDAVRVYAALKASNIHIIYTVGV